MTNKINFVTPDDFLSHLTYVLINEERRKKFVYTPEYYGYEIKYKSVMLNNNNRLLVILIHINKRLFLSKCISSNW